MLARIERLLADTSVTDVMLSPATGLWVDDDAGLRRLHDVEVTESAARALAEKLLALGGRHIDYLTPMADARLAHGVRVHAVLAPVASTGTSVSIRVARHSGLALSEMCSVGFLSPVQVDVLRSAVLGHRNVLVSGATGTGKTTLLAAMLAEVPHAQRIVVVEDVAELRVGHPHVVGLEARQPNAEGVGGVGLAALVRQALRMRPDRLVVGECRGPELLDFLTALNTGHSGGGITIHANSLGDVPARLEALAEANGLAAGALARLAASAIDLVVHLERIDGVRRVAALGHLSVRGDRLIIEEGQ